MTVLLPGLVGSVHKVRKATEEQSVLLDPAELKVLAETLVTLVNKARKARLGPVPKACKVLKVNKALKELVPQVYRAFRAAKETAVRIAHQS